MTLQLLHSEFPDILGKNFIFFFISAGLKIEGKYEESDKIVCAVYAASFVQ
jgi:hypothetical protein